MRILVKIFGLVLLFLTLECLIQAEENLNQEQELKAGFELPKIKAIWSELTLNQADPFADRMFVSVSKSIDYEELTFHVTDGKHSELFFLQKDKSLIGFFDGAIFNNLINSQEAKLYDFQDRPKWTEDQALGQGKKVLARLVDLNLFHFASPFVKYVHEKNGEKYYQGYWRIEWPRTDSKGHSFDGENVSLKIFESKGPFSGGVHLPSKYVEPNSEPLKSEDVQDKAWKAAQAATTWPPVKSVIEPEGHLEPKPFSVTLRIVKPNHMLQGNQISTHYDLNARLAWVFWYAWKSENNSQQDQSIAIWIDSYTGEMLGGDVGM